MKTIVTHFHPDVDAICAVWLLKTFLPGWDEAVVAFVSAGQTLENKVVDSDDEVLHVDTGLGKFDHHQTNEETCASRLVFEYLRELRIKHHELGANKRSKGSEFHEHAWHEEALERLIQLVTEIDHFKQVEWPEPNSDRYDLGIEAILDGWKLANQKRGQEDDLVIVERGMLIFDGVYASLSNKVWAEEELKAKKEEFTTRWGKGVAIETFNDDVIPLALKRGYVVAVRKDPKKGYVRIKSLPTKGVDLTPTYEAIQKKDPQATWFLHASKQMVLNGTAKNPTMKATKLGLKEVIEIIKNS